MQDFYTAAEILNRTYRWQIGLANRIAVAANRDEDYQILKQAALSALPSDIGIDMNVIHVIYDNAWNQVSWFEKLKRRFRGK
jgi:hypothetical protein